MNTIFHVNKLAKKLKELKVNIEKLVPVDEKQWSWEPDKDFRGSASNEINKITKDLLKLFDDSYWTAGISSPATHKFFEDLKKHLQDSFTFKLSPSVIAAKWEEVVRFACVTGARPKTLEQMPLFKLLVKILNNHKANGSRSKFLSAPIYVKSVRDYLKTDVFPAICYCYCYCWQINWTAAVLPSRLDTLRAWIATNLLRRPEDMTAIESFVLPGGMKDWCQQFPLSRPYSVGLEPAFLLASGLRETKGMSGYIDACLTKLGVSRQYSRPDPVKTTSSHLLEFYNLFYDTFVRGDIKANRFPDLIACWNDKRVTGESGDKVSLSAYSRYDLRATASSYTCEDELRALTAMTTTLGNFISAGRHDWRTYGDVATAIGTRLKIRPDQVYDYLEAELYSPLSARRKLARKLYM